MTRTVVTVAVVMLSIGLAGCESDTGRGALIPNRSGLSGEIDLSAVSPALGVAEADLVEQVATSRQEYRRGLQMLIEHYEMAGNNMKYRWAKRELEALDRTPQYRFIVEAEPAGPELRAIDRIPQADQLFAEAVELQRQAEPLRVLKDDQLLRLALHKYNELIRTFPTSDKIDDAAYRAAGIYEYFNDYTIALLYYQRAYQWDPQTANPARFQAASILDKKLRRRDEALELYKEAVEKEVRFTDWVNYGKRRIAELTRADEQ